MSIHLAIKRSKGNNLKKARKGFLLIEAMIGLTLTILFSAVILQIRTQLALWHTQSVQYLHAVTLMDRIIERVQLHKSIPDQVHQFSITTSSKKYENMPYTQIKVTLSWLNPHNQKKELTVFTGIIHEA